MLATWEAVTNLRIQRYSKYMTQKYGLYSYLPKEPTEELPVDRLISHLIKSLPQSVTNLREWQNASVLHSKLYAFQVKGTVKKQTN